MTIRYFIHDTTTGRKVEVTRAQCAELHGEERTAAAESGKPVAMGAAIIEAVRISPGSPEKSTARALLALAAAINYGEQAHRALPEVHGPGRDLRDSAQFNLAQAGRALGNAYDSLRTLAEILNRS